MAAKIRLIIASVNVDGLLKLLEENKYYEQCLACIGITVTFLSYPTHSIEAKVGLLPLRLLVKKKATSSAIGPLDQFKELTPEGNCILEKFCIRFCNLVIHAGLAGIIRNVLSFSSTDDFLKCSPTLSPPKNYIFSVHNQMRKVIVAHWIGSFPKPGSDYNERWN